MSEIKSQVSFDDLRRVDEKGEHWMARELMPHVDYAKWQNFQRAINFARVAMSKEGYQLSEHFSLESVKTSDQGGRPGTDWRMSRLACKFVFINGDPNKPGIAAAQNYFVQQSEYAEQVQSQVAQQPASGFPIPRTHAEALRAYANELEAREAAELHAAEAKAEADMLRPPAEAWEHLADAGQDYSVREAAYILVRDPAIDTGPRRLFQWIQDNGMAQRRADGQYIPYAAHADHLRLKVQSRPAPDGDDDYGLRREANSQLRVTVKGLQWIQQRLREQSRPDLTASIPRQPEGPVRPALSMEEYRRILR